MTDHTHAPATNLLATNCAVCGRALVDAQSVETGIGPICRERYGNFTALSEPARVEANGIVYRIAATLSQTPDAAGLATVSTDLQRLRTLGADTIVQRILNNRGRLATIKIITVDADTDRFAVQAPRNDDATAAYRSIRGRRWHGSYRSRAWHGVTKANTFPRSAWPQVRAALVANYPGAFVRLPDGEVAILADDLAPGFDVPDAPAVDATPAGVTITITDAPTRGYGSGRRIAVATPYDAGVVAAMRNVRGRRWDGANRVNTFPLAALAGVLRIVRQQWPDATFDNRSAHAVVTTVQTRIDAAPVTTAVQSLPDVAESASPTDDAPRAADGWLASARTSCSDYAPDVAYDATKADHRVWLAESMLHCLETAGFATVTVRGARERVLGLRVGDATVLVYTSISGNAMRTSGADAIRVALVRNGRGVASTTRVNRTGNMDAIIGRVLDRCGDVTGEVVAA